MLDAFDEFESPDESEEIFALQTWSEEIRKNRPITLKQRLAQQLQEAISDEKYERAATLRDRLNGLEKKRF
jgi:protein-arginine kinase activator protein McsA